MSSIFYRDRQGESITLERYAELMGDLEYSRVARHEEAGHVVSTVWLGLDHGIFGGGPLIFETMIFGPKVDGEYQERYSTEADAQAGHERAIEHLRREILGGAA